MRLLAVAVLAVALGPPLAAAGAGAGREGASDPSGDETAALVLPLGIPAANLSCHDPSIDILAVTATVHGRTLRVEVRHAAPVLAPQLSCEGMPLAVAGQAYGISVEGSGDSFLLVSVGAAEACLYVLFQNPAQTSECLPAAQANGTAIQLETGLRGLVPVGEGALRPYKLSGPLAIHAFNEEFAVRRPGPGLPFTPDALLLVEDQTDVDTVLTLR